MRTEGEFLLPRKKQKDEERERERDPVVAFFCVRETKQRTFVADPVSRANAPLYVLVFITCLVQVSDENGAPELEKDKASEREQRSRAKPKDRQKERGAEVEAARVERQGVGAGHTVVGKDTGGDVRRGVSGVGDCHRDPQMTFFFKKRRAMIYSMVVCTRLRVLRSGSVALVYNWTPIRR